MKSIFLALVFFVFLFSCSCFAFPIYCNDYFRVYGTSVGTSQISVGEYARAAECNVIAGEEAWLEGKLLVSLQHYKYAGYFFALGGNVSRAKDAYLNAVELALQAEEFNWAGHIYTDLSAIETNPVKRTSYQRKAVECYAKGGNYSLAANYSKKFFGEYPESISYWEQGAIESDGRADFQWTAHYYTRAAEESAKIGSTHRSKENYLKALDFYRKALEEESKHGNAKNNDWGEAAALIGMAKTYEALGETTESQHYHLEAAKEYEKVGGYWHSAESYAKIGDWRKACQNLEKSMEADKRAGEFYLTSYAIYYPRLFVYGLLAFVQDMY